MSRTTLVRIATFLATVFAAWGVLSFGAGDDEPDLQAGNSASRTYTAQVSANVDDIEETDRLRKEARDAVNPVLEVDLANEALVRSDVEELFAAVAESVIAPSVPPSPPVTVPDESDATTPQDTEEPVDAAEVSGVVYLDRDSDGFFQTDLGDVGLGRIQVVVSSAGSLLEVETDSQGIWVATIEPGEILVTVDFEDEDIPEGFVVAESTLQQSITCDPGAECEVAPVGFVANLRALDVAAGEIAATHFVPTETAEVLVRAAMDDVTRTALGQVSHLTVIRGSVLQRVNEEFGRRIEAADVLAAKNRQRTSPPLVLYPDTGLDMEAGQAAGEVVATYLRENYRVNEDATENARIEAANAVVTVSERFTAGQVIANEGDNLSQLQVDAILDTSGLIGAVNQQGGLLAVLAVLVGSLGFYLARFRPEFWARPRMVALIGILIVLAAVAVRATTVVQPNASWYVLPAVAFGFITAVLFDSRIGVLMALAVGVVAALGTRDAGVAVYATLATMAPIGFVSSVSTRRAFRNAVVYSAAAAAVAGAATASFFHATSTISALDAASNAVVWAFGASVVASLVGMAALQFFESAFDITTTLRLLDLTDRNHEGLQLLQEKAFGTFNHSLMVGTLADAAARAIGADPLLARAMAYYHDLGKTENPMFFIENQFGITNPHDELDPADSADIIRAHVTDGLALAAKHKIPSDVAEGIVSHHGDGIMRFFYEKAQQRSAEPVDPAAFRHIGHKPRSAETAIVMLADSLEAACRAVFQSEEPTPQAIEKVVDRVVDEKVNDNQLSESPVTLEQLTRIRGAFLDSLVGHYHQRIQYPNFPGA